MNTCTCHEHVHKSSTRAQVMHTCTHLPSLAHRILCDGALHSGFEALYRLVPFMPMLLADPAVHALSPCPETPGFQFATHQCHYFGFGQTKLMPNGFKGRAIFPRHFYDAVNLFQTECRRHAQSTKTPAFRFRETMGYVGKRWDMLGNVGIRRDTSGCVCYRLMRLYFSISRKPFDRTNSLN